MRLGHYYALGLSHGSGVTAAMGAWARKQQAHGDEVTVLTANGPAQIDYGVPVVRVPHVGVSRRSLAPPPLDFMRAIKELDLVILHEGWTMSHYAAAACCRRLGIPYVTVPHGVYEPEVVGGLKLRRGLRERLERQLLEGAAGVHLFFESEGDLIRRLAPSAHVFVAPTGVDGDSHQASSRPAGEGPLLWYGRMDVKHKGLDLMLAGLASLPREARPRLRLAGYDYRGGRQELRQLIAELCLHESVSLEPALDDTAKRSALSECLAYVHPSRWECHSIALLEALQSGAGVVASDGMRISPLLAGSGAATVVESSAAGWAKVFGDLYAHGIGSQPRTGLFLQFDWDFVLATTRSQYREFVEGRFAAERSEKAAT